MTLLYPRSGYVEHRPEDTREWFEGCEDTRNGERYDDLRASGCVIRRIGGGAVTDCRSMFQLKEEVWP